MADTVAWLVEADLLRKENARLREGLLEVLAVQGDIIPVYNDEFIRASWVREIAERALSSSSAAGRQADG